MSQEQDISVQHDNTIENKNLNKVTQLQPTLTFWS